MRVSLCMAKVIWSQYPGRTCLRLCAILFLAVLSNLKADLFAADVMIGPFSARSQTNLDGNGMPSYAFEGLAIESNWGLVRSDGLYFFRYGRSSRGHNALMRPSGQVLGYEGYSHNQGRLKWNRRLCRQTRSLASGYGCGKHTGGEF